MPQRSRQTAAVTAQVAAQALTAWSAVFAFTGGGEFSIWFFAPLLAAFVVPLRHDGTVRDRATGNFGAAVLVAGIFWWELLFGLLNRFGPGEGTIWDPATMFLLTAAVLFALAGGLFWTAEEGGR